MRVLVIGKAKTGTTALVSLIRQALEPCKLVMEPKSVLEFGAASLQRSSNEAIKIIYEHFRNQPRHLNALVHQEFGFSIDKVVFITRDIRDEVISRLLYLPKVLRDKALSNGRKEREWKRWVCVLEEKERCPSEVSFKDLCSSFQDIFQVDAWADVIDAIRLGQAYEQYISSGVVRDRYVQSYEAMIRNETSGLAKYLDLTLPSDVMAVELGAFKYTKRSGASGNWKSFFTEHDVALLRPMIESSLGHGIYEDWELESVARLDSAAYSGYVKRVAMG
ncbi:MAG: hypothetical protein ACREMD_02365 [Gemmatimonadota bacterium]